MGLDVILDADLKPYLLEVNAMPDMRCYSRDQLRLKRELIHDAVACIFPSISPEDLDLLFGSSASTQAKDALWSETLNPAVDRESQSASTAHQNPAHHPNWVNL